MKIKGEEKYTRLDVEFQRIAKSDKSFFNEQCKVEGNNRMGKTRDLFKKTGDIKGTFHARMGAIKDRNGKFNGYLTSLTSLNEVKWALGRIIMNKARWNSS